MSLPLPSTSQYLSLTSSSSMEESNLRALQSTCHTKFKLLLLGISFTNSQVSGKRRNICVRSLERAVSHQCWTERFSSTRRSPYLRSNSEKCTLSINSTRCRACGEISGTVSSSRITGIENSAGRVVTHTTEQNGTTVEKKVAIVWFKHDLRMDDHVGLTSALQYDHVLPLFIFDSSFYAGTFPD